jgi:hypothetical protein
MIELVRFKKTFESLTSQTHGVLSIYDGDNILFRCNTLERRWKPNFPYSCIPPAPGEKQTYTLRKKNTFGNTMFQYLELLGDKTWLIQVDKESPIYFGEELCFCEGTGLYEFNDFRKTLNKIVHYLKDEEDVVIYWTDNTNIISATHKTKSYFSDDEILPTYPIVE